MRIPEDSARFWTAHLHYGAVYPLTDILLECLDAWISCGRIGNPPLAF